MFPRADVFPIQLVLMKPVLSGYWSRKNRHKCLMVIEDILRRKGSDTQCVFLSGAKCLHQAGRSQWLGKQWIVWASNDALGLWGEARGDRGANCKNTRGEGCGFDDARGVSPTNNQAHDNLIYIMLSQQPYTYMDLLPDLNYFVELLHFKSLQSKTADHYLLFVLSFLQLHVPRWQCDRVQEMQTVPSSASVCKMSTWSDALARFPHALVLCYGLCRCSMWSETYKITHPCTCNLFMSGSQIMCMCVCMRGLLSSAVHIKKQVHARHPGNRADEGVCHAIENVPGLIPPGDSVAYLSVSLLSNQVCSLNNGLIHAPNFNLIFPRN